MAPPKTNETSHDALKKILSDIAQLSILPDADLQFVQQLQELIVGKLRESGAAQSTPGAMAGGGAPGSMQGSMQGGMPPVQPSSSPMAGGANGPMMGVNPMGSNPPGGAEAGGQNVDELMRMLSSGAGATGG